MYPGPGCTMPEAILRAIRAMLPADGAGHKGLRPTNNLFTCLFTSSSAQQTSDAAQRPGYARRPEPSHQDL